MGYRASVASSVRPLNPISHSWRLPYRIFNATYIEIRRSRGSRIFGSSFYLGLEKKFFLLKLTKKMAVASVEKTLIATAVFECVFYFFRWNGIVETITFFFKMSSVRKIKPVWLCKSRCHHFLVSNSGIKMVI